MAEGFDGLALGLIGAGGLIAYAGLKGLSIPSAIQALVQGQTPAGAAKANPINPTSVSTALAAAQAAVTPVNSAGQSGTATGSGSAIAADAMKYAGAGYVWGGAPAGGVGDWDCSSFVNWVCGHDLGLAIPGYAAGAYNGSSHGPVVASWLTWSGLSTVTSPQAGDIVCFGLDTHMGIMLGPSTMISAQNPSAGTKVSGITGFGSPTTFRRYG